MTTPPGASPVPSSPASLGAGVAEGSGGPSEQEGGALLWLARRALFPLVLALGVGATYAGLAAGYSPALVLNVVTTLAFVLVMVLEYLLPHREDWRASDGQIAYDLGHTWLGTGLGALGGNLTVAYGAPLLAGALWGGASWWPSHWPFALQVVVIYLVADMGRYWQHRLHHAVPFLWRFHALHHSVGRMSVFKTSRSHFVERYLQQVSMFGLLIVLGCPLEILIWYIVPNSVVGLLDHSNLDVRLGRFEWLIMGPGAHRLHHSSAPEDIDTNFGSALVFWDMLFGTYRDPTRVPPPPEVGILEDPIPTTGFWRQYFSPFLWDRLVRERQEA